MEEKLRLSEQKLTNYLQNAADMIFTVNAEGKMTYISPNCVKICGFEPEDFIGKKTSVFFSQGYPEHGKNRDPFTAVSGSGSKSTYHTFRMEHRDGITHWYGVTISKTLEENGSLLLICNARNIDKNIEKEKKLEQLSLYDHLTGVANKAFFDAMLKSSQTSGQRPLSILVCDMDQLKAINDRYGHARGDEAIKITAQLIRSSLRKADFIARIGGDEFAVILPGAGRDEAMAVLQRIHKSFAVYNSGKKGPPFTISVGLSTVNDTDTSLEAALYSADIDMYRRKHAH